MWVKKTKEEIKNLPNKKLFFWNAIIIAILSLLTIILTRKTGLNKFGDSKGLSWSELFSESPMYLLIVAVIFIVAFRFQLKKNISLIGRETTYICDKCNNKKLDDGKYNCECGGEFIHINLMKWVEDEENDTEEPS